MNGEPAAAVRLNKMLIVDDSGLSRMILKKKIVHLLPDAEFEDAVNGKQCLDRIKELAEEGNQFDMVFIDQMMPVMDGLEALKKIREMSSTLPVVMVTANIQDKTRDAAIRLGCTDFINKTTEDKNLPRALGLT